MKFPYFSPDINRIIERVLRVNLFLQENESFLVASDYPSPLDIKYRETDIIERILKRNFLAKLVYSIAKEKFPKTKTDFLAYPCPWKHYPELEKDFVENFLNYDVAYIISEFSISNMIWSTNRMENRTSRIALSPMCDDTIFLPNGPLDIDDNKLENEVMILYAKLKKSEEFRLYTHLGTDLTIDVSKASIRHESGIIDLPQKEANLPAGEVSISGAIISGKYIVPSGWLEGLRGNLELEIKNNYVIKIDQVGDSKNWLEKNYNLKSSRARIHHISIGLNENATNPFLPIELEKMRGVTSLAIRQTQDVQNPLETIIFSGNLPVPNTYLEVNNELIFKNGRFLI